MTDKAATGAPAWKEEAVRKAIAKVLAHAKGDTPAEDLPRLVRAKLEADVLADLGGEAELERLLREVQKAGA